VDKKTKTTKKIQKKEKDKNIKIPKTKVQKLKLKHKKLIFIIVLLLIIFIGMFFIKTTQEETKIEYKVDNYTQKYEEYLDNKFNSEKDVNWDVEMKWLEDD
jgi:cytoskeletal protein RodZ